jgi:hypothetical protein
MVKLTRYLYCEDEVKASLISSLLKRVGIQECYYWLSELYYSGSNIFDIIWEIYIDYYALTTPHLEKYIIKKQAAWEKDKNEEHLCTIIKNLYISQANGSVFILRHMCLIDDISPSHILKGRPKNWLVKYNKDYRELIHFIHSNKWNDVCYQLINLTNNKNKSFNELFGIIYEYCLNELSDIKKHETLLETIKNMWDEKQTKNNLQYLILIICVIKSAQEIENITEEKEDDKHIYVLPNKSDIEFFKKTNIVSETIKPRNVLLSKRLYYIDGSVGCFNLERFRWNNHEDFKSEMLLNWEYYATRTHIWDERIKKYHVKFDIDKRKITFEDEVEEDEFYEKYNYEPDEQCKELQECGLLEIKKAPLKDWIIGNKLEIDTSIMKELDSLDIPDITRLTI